MSSTYHEYIARRQERFAAGVDVEKLRLGQQACEIVNVLSDPEIRFALIPLTEGEYRRSLELAENIQLIDNNTATDLLRDQVQKEAIIYFAAREVTDLSERFFGHVDDVQELTHMDVAHAYDLYLEMTSQISPTQMGMSEEDFQSLKTLLPRISWSELSGPQWYAGQRFLKFDPTTLTHGQILWITCNLEIDRKEREAKECYECVSKRDIPRCPSCGKEMPARGVFDELSDEMKENVREAARMDREGVSENGRRNAESDNTL